MSESMTMATATSKLKGYLFIIRLYYALNLLQN